MTPATPAGKRNEPRRFYEALEMSDRRLLLVALAVSLLVAGVIALKIHDLTTSLGDTDDAMRLVRVRELAAGQGWYDQLVRRLQPPLGSQMHWSRLVDAGEAALLVLFRWVLPQPLAELALRWIWPLAWIAPAVAAALAMARRLAGGVGVYAAAVVMVATTQLFIQFAPGRIDHHNLQIVCALVAAAAAMQDRHRAGPVIGAAATALGLAIGVEALPFHGMIVGTVLLRAAMQAEHRAGGITFGLSLGVATLSLFLLQTPPDLWPVARCDALSPNLVLPILVAGWGAAAALVMTRAQRPTGRVVAITLPGLAAAALYVMARPQCLHGPIGEVDRRLFDFWFAHSAELQPLPALFAMNRPVFAAVLGTTTASVIASLVFAWLRRRTVGAEAALAVGLALLAAVGALQVARMNDYAGWFAVPVIAAVAVGLGMRFRRQQAALALAVAFSLSPGLLMAVIARLPGVALSDLQGRPRTMATSVPGAGACIDTDNFAVLARLPAGLVAAPIDLGPYILANSDHAVLSAPYHRMGAGILAAQAILEGDSALAKGRAAALGVRYVVDCPSQPFGRLRGSVTDALRRGARPAWLVPRAPPTATLQIYEVRW